MTTTIVIPVPDGTSEAYVAGPGDRSTPGVLFYMDAFGLRPQIADMMERIAGWGYTVLAPNVFHRDGRVADLAQDRDRAMESGPRPDPRQPRGRHPFVPRRAAWPVRTARSGPPATAWARGSPSVPRPRTPTTSPRSAGFHGGGLATDDDSSPHLGLPAARAEFVFGHADHDRSMPPEAVGRLGEALASAGLVFINDVYAGAPHGYTMNDTQKYHEESAERHYRVLESLLDRTLR